MIQIGRFTRTKTGYSGRLTALGIDVELAFVSAEPSDAENAPNYRILLAGHDGIEIGAGWKHVGERAGDYVTVQLDSPLFPRPLRANLFRSGDDDSAWGLHWSRPAKPRKEH
ncbi:DUF736 domain-containing protein [Mesorhizobium loti]|uniref:Uncharacterized protein n=1 Tax=Rhizobium loti TaxID=381 RepID=A0A6M7U1G7_RHILI|nr:DUF736 domain-containing protein [Mesorhizobium loti]OBQ62242.1 hypothetical protein A8145_21555 [Mesorhizobium loti]QKC71309.1 DUF736 domain-containing protein [Mesorhizobium loti]